MAKRSLVVTIGGGFIALCVAFIVIAYTYQVITGKNLAGDSVASSNTGTGSNTQENSSDSNSQSGSVWNGYRISGTIPDACKGKPMPSSFDIAQSARSAAMRYGNPKGDVEAQLIEAGDFSFNSIGEGEDGKCAAFFTVRGDYDGTSFAEDVVVTL
jgi:hypothetical protein